MLGLIDQAINKHMYMLQKLFFTIYKKLFCHIFDMIVLKMLQ